jgi:transmembrane sensor
MIKRIKHSLEYLIDKNFQNKTSEKEEKLLNDFILSEYQNSKWDDVKMGSRDEASITIFEGIQLRINKKDTFQLYLKYVAAASIIFLVGLGFLYKPSNSTEKQLVFTSSSSSKLIRLSDGSKVYLATNSRLGYPAHFGGDERKVSLLKGNAFFEIAKDKKHPFIISSGGIKTKVVGTSFHIQLSKSKCQVMVVTGKVNVTAKGQSVDLVPNEMASFRAQKLTKQLADTTLLVNWYANDVTLNQATLEQVINILQCKYGVKFEFSNEAVLSTPITVFIEKDASLKSVLQQINYITNLKFNIYGEIVKVT